jgi:hypothetical protein
VNQLKEIMTHMGLKCQLRDGQLSPELTSFAIYSELWVNEGDYGAAVALLARLKAKVAARDPMSRWLYRPINPVQNPFGQRAGE